MKITDVEFVASATGKKGYPPAGLPEIVLIGRSNVGKSSLINKLVNRKKLARTSSTPGKTQTVNFYRINNKFFFVDLPGFGYAKVPRDVQKAWGPMIDRYMGAGRNIAGAIILLDIRRTPGEAEHNLYGWLNDFNIPLLTVLTKGDKLSKSRRAAKAREVEGLMPGLAPVVFSATSGLGKDLLMRHIQSMIEDGS
ncbi:MAG: ribosome biogenesis GTP-binding protein YihA/YsxC [Thermodesulfobacteriota bacterium]